MLQPTQTGTIADNLARVQDEIARCAAHCGRAEEEITLVGVSKTQPAEVVAAAVAAGLRHIGENRVQEAHEKLPAVRQLLGQTPMPVCHLVGHLQTNKAGAALGLFDRIDAVDSLKLMLALGRRLAGTERELPVLLEIYVGDDPNRPGLRPDGIEDSVGQLLEVPGLRIEGLMTVAPLGSPPGPAFRQVREIKLRLAQAYPRVHFGVLSMGMSEDFQVAIQEGSTEVRIGTALFGPRQRP
jgi:pyridoxal phosphate enzyme (YggS family)